MAIEHIKPPQVPETEEVRRLFGGLPMVEGDALTLEPEGGESVGKEGRGSDASLQAKLEVIHAAAIATLPLNTDGFSDYGVIATFEDAVILRNYDEGRLYEMAYSRVGDEFVFGAPREVQEIYVQKRLFLANPQLVVKDIQTLIDKWDDWAGSFEGALAALTGKPGIDNPAALCAWLHYQAKGEWPSTPTSMKGAGIELTGPIVFKDEARRIAYAAVLVPGEKDSDGEILSKEEIERVAHKWLERYGNVDLMHSLQNVATPVESYLLPMDMNVVLQGEKVVLPQGSWILASKITEDASWTAVCEGRLSGYSVMGIRPAALKGATATNLPGALKRTLLRDLGPDWIAAFVSLVDTPAVPKAKWFALKASPPTGPVATLTALGAGARQTFQALLKRVTGVGPDVEEADPAEKEGRRFSNATVGQLKKAIDALEALLQEAEKERGAKKDAGNKPGEEDGIVSMTKEEVQALLKAELGTAVTEALKTHMEPLATWIKERQDAEKKTTDDEAAKTVREALKTELKAEVLAEIAKAVGGSKGEAISRALKGQDGDSTEPAGSTSPAEGNRDEAGRSRKRRY